MCLLAGNNPGIVVCVFEQPSDLVFVGVEACLPGPAARQRLVITKDQGFTLTRRGPELFIYLLD